MVSITANGNITGEGVKINGTDGVLVHANGKLDLHEARDVRSESSSQTVKKSGFAGSIGGIPVPIGAGSRDDTSTSSNTLSPAASPARTAACCSKATVQPSCGV